MRCCKTQVALAAGKRTAWIDKGPYYELVQVRVKHACALLSMFMPLLSAPAHPLAGLWILKGCRLKKQHVHWFLLVHGATTKCSA